MGDVIQGAGWREADRLAALERYGILDTAPEADFDDIVRIAAQICGVPVALISLIDDHRQWFKATLGLEAKETSREVAFCNVAIQQRPTLVVPDATLDPRFSANPLVVDDPSIRFYAGAQLVTPDGFPLGTLCVIDNKPHDLDPEQRAALEALARQVMNQLELRLALTRQKADEAHRMLLVGELQHRAKNTLSLVQALVSQTLRNAASMADAKRAIEDRLVALSRAFDLLTDADWGPAPIGDVIAGAIAGSGGETSQRIRLAGEDVSLKPRAALALALVLHELVTNAAKYGALSNETGAVDVDWSVATRDGEAALRFRWRESGGPTVTAPTRRGFGSRLIEASVAGDLGGRGKVEYDAAGLRWTLVSPAAHVLEDVTP